MTEIFMLGLIAVFVLIFLFYTFLDPDILAFFCRIIAAMILIGIAAMLLGSALYVLGVRL